MSDPSPVSSRPPRKRFVKRVGGWLLLTFVVLAGAGFFWLREWWEVPVASYSEELPPLPHDFSLRDVRLPAHGDAASIDLDSWRPVGQTSCLYLCDMRAISDPIAIAWVAALGELVGEDSKESGRLIGVIEFPEFPALLRGPPTRMLTKFANEFPFPMRIDFGGTVRKQFQIPEGVSGVVLLGPDGSKKRLIGELDDKKRDELRRFFGGSGSTAVRAPQLRTIAGLEGLRAGAAVGIAFLAREIREAEAPAFDSTPLGMLLRGFEPPADPSVRLVTFLAGASASTNDSELVIAGKLDGFAAKPWKRVVDDAALRSAFGIPAGEAAIVAIDGAGFIRVRVVGKTPMWRLGVVAEVLGLPPPGT